MKKGVYDMTYIYVKDRKNGNIYLEAQHTNKSNIKKEISENMVNACAKKISREISEFVGTITRDLIQEK